MLKKKLLLFITYCSVILMITGCASGNKSDINIGCMKGPTAVGMVKMLSDSDSGVSENNYNYTITGTADELTAGLLNGSIDIAAVPCNLASVLYNKTDGEIVTIAINTLGVLYILESGNTISDINDLAGKTIYSTGQGTTPEYTLRYLLTKAGLDPDKDVNIEYKSEAAEVVSAMTQNKEAIAMLPQPYVTAAMKNNSKLRIALDITKEWELLDDKSTIVTGVIVARKTFIEQMDQSFKVFIKEYEQSTKYAVSNVDKTAELLEQFDIFNEQIAKDAIPYCNVTYIDGEEMSEKMLSYLTVLYEQNPISVGGKLPEEGIFYIEKNKNK